MGANTDISIPILSRMKRGNMKLDLSLDYHAHILPGCDHGSDGLATSLKQVEMAASAGVKTMQRRIFTRTRSPSNPSCAVGRKLQGCCSVSCLKTLR